MSYLKFSTDCFLEKQELNRLIQFIVDEGYRKSLLDNSFSFGIIKTKDDSVLNNFKVETSGSGEVKIVNTSYAIDKNGLIIVKNPQSDIAIPAGGDWYWIKIKHEYSPKETGTVSIDANGNLTGTGTAFEDVLRGQPNFPARIKFYGSTLNILEYDVVEVIDDNNVVLSGVFQAETDLEYSVIGTFSPDAVPISDEKEIFQYDSCIAFTVAAGGLVAEDPLTPNVPPTITLTDEEFYIARVKNDSGVITIHDKRTDFWRTKVGYDLWYIDKTTVNSVIGIESVKYDNPFSPRVKNQVMIGWGIRTFDWSYSPELRKFTITNCDNGRYKDADGFINFTDGDFNGWRLYAKNGSWKTVISSIKSGGSLLITVDSLDIDDYEESVDEIIIVPDVEEIQIQAWYDEADTEIEQIDNVFTFPINKAFGKLFLLVPSASVVYKYNIKYRYKKFREYTEWTVLPDDIISGYYDETSYDENGVLNLNPLDRNRKTYEPSALPDLDDGYIELIPSSRSYYNRLAGLETGDLFGVQELMLDPAVSVVHLTVGSSYQYQVIKGNGITLSSDMYINIKKTNVDGDSCINGNNFILHFNQAIADFNGCTIKIVTDYVSPSSYVLLREYTEEIDSFVSYSPAGYFVKCIFDATDWILNSTNEITKQQYSANTNGAGVWRRVAKNILGSGRGQAIINLYIAGGVYAPDYLTIRVDSFWSDAYGGFTLDRNMFTGSTRWDKVRLVYIDDGLGNPDSQAQYIEVYFNTDLTGFGLQLIDFGYKGYETGWDLYYNDLPVGNVGGETIIQESNVLGNIHVPDAIYVAEEEVITGNVGLKTKVVTIGDWDLLNDATHDVPLGNDAEGNPIDVLKSRIIGVQIWDDFAANFLMTPSVISDGSSYFGISSLQSIGNRVVLIRNSGGSWGTYVTPPGTPPNRGWLTVMYEG